MESEMSEHKAASMLCLALSQMWMAVAYLKGEGSYVALAMALLAAVGAICFVRLDDRT
jgi:hypothetical protein